MKDQTDLLRLIFASEGSLSNVRINDWFEEEFFETNYWYLWTSMFAFQKWSSVAAMRRYMKRFIHLLVGMPKLTGIMRTKYNQYHSVVVPLQRYLQKRGVHFEMQTQVVDIDFSLSSDVKVATALHTTDENGKTEKISLGDND
jgi:oleate hydratase